MMPRRPPARSSICLFLLAVLAACQGTPTGPTVVGRWVGTDGRGTQQTLVLAADGSAQWTVEGRAGSQSFDVRYRFDATKTPQQLDLLGFASGPLQGLSLYGIVEWSRPEAFRFEAEPGLPTDGGDSVRPVQLSKRAIVFVRQP